VVKLERENIHAAMAIGTLALFAPADAVSLFTSRRPNERAHAILIDVNAICLPS